VRARALGSVRNPVPDGQHALGVGLSVAEGEFAVRIGNVDDGRAKPASQPLCWNPLIAISKKSLGETPGNEQ